MSVARRRPFEVEGPVTANAPALSQGRPNTREKEVKLVERKGRAGGAERGLYAHKVVREIFWCDRPS